MEAFQLFRPVDNFFASLTGHKSLHHCTHKLIIQRQRKIITCFHSSTLPRKIVLLFPHAELHKIVAEHTDSVHFITLCSALSGTKALLRQFNRLVQILTSLFARYKLSYAKKLVVLIPRSLCYAVAATCN